MGAPRFTEAELRRAVNVARAAGADIEITRGTIRILAGPSRLPVSFEEIDGDEAQCDAAFGGPR
ncbi:hypothetical protein JMM63_20370 [Rhodovulum sulfidophilum]|uniref:Uncharacterized protein n=2 Tax=Rhodovulum TaxID=34008 RepID=A0ABS1S0F2_RHOSU|nr:MULTISPECIES: hypothetical protein [Rhodovulum]ANB32770.1 hypothetical protein A6W98_00965 [Rhodovulum sulfidophilum DSM 1374]ANB36619.1 hypothetical protein A6024_00950 [Rhodovulum sulfidophilum]ARC89993.1 hypothetical protein B5V46_15960 [Rhodovulum sp. MB263]MBK5924895.1 hypothetical protein [Rhodovulum sulfidophilum]MBL3552612.1 hypothetical protein [Rhodovulum sulfidophilum]